MMHGQTQIKNKIFDILNFSSNCSVIIVTVQIITLHMKGSAKQLEESFSV